MSSAEKKLRDQALIGDEIAPGVRRVLRRRGDDGDLELGEFHEIAEGQALPLGGELVYLDRSADDDGWHDVKSIYGGRSGPPQVATPAYRLGYDRIFGKQKVGLA